MKNKKAFIERAKNVLIVLLVISAAVLSVKNGYFSAVTDRLTRAFGHDPGETYMPQGGSGSENPELAMPSAVLASRGGVFFASVYDRAAVEESFGLFSAYFSEALGSAGAAESIGEDDFRSLLEGGSAVFCYDVPRKLDLLGRWLSTEMLSPAKDCEASLAVLSPDGDAVRLLIRTSEGEFYSCGTAVSAEALEARIGSMSGERAYFAYEDELYAGCGAYCVIPENMPSIPGVNATDAVGTSLNAAVIMGELGMNSLVSTSYRETDGTVVYIEGSKTLRIDPRGRLGFSEESGSRAYAGTGEAEAVGIAEALIKACAESVGGDAVVAFSGLRYDEAPGQYTVSFRYEIDGIPVESELGDAGEIRIKNGSITSAELLLRRYDMTEETEKPLPAVQAFALASASGGDAALVYADHGESVRCVWVMD